MKRLAYALFLFLALCAASWAQSSSAASPDKSPRKFVFPGGTVLQVKTDEMTDRQSCSIFTPGMAVHLAFYGRDGAAIWTSEYLNVDYAAPALMRLGDAGPFSLDVERRPHMLSIPPDRTPELFAALRARQRIRIRFSEWPSGNPRDFDLDSGDFAAAYDRASELCAWTKMPRPGAPLSREPEISTGEDGSITAWFGGRAGWSVFFSSKYARCSIGPGDIQGFLFSMFGRRRNPNSLLGDVYVHSPDGQVVAKFRPYGSDPFPLEDFLLAADRAGESGWVENFGAATSLFGLREAIAFAEKTCRLTIR